MKQKTPSAKERALEWIRHAVITGELAGGDFLEEAVVCDAVGVSRTPVREALNQAAAQKFVTLSRKRGAQVRTVSARELDEVYKTRTVLEQHAAKTLCHENIPVTEHARQALAARTESIAKLKRDPSNIDLVIESSNDDWLLHYSIVEAAGNSVMSELFASLQHWQQRVAIAIMMTPTQHALLEQIESEHSAMINAWESHDADTFLPLVERHLHPHSEVVAFL